MARGRGDIGPSRRNVPRGLVENQARQELARTLVCRGALTVRGVMKDTGRSMAFSRYHLRVLSAAGAVTPFVKGVAKDDEVAYALSAERLPEWAQEVLLGEVSLQTCFRLLGILLFEGPQDATELGARLGLCPREVARYMKALRAEGLEEDLPRLGTGKRADRASDYPEWLTRWLDGLDEEGGDSDSRER